ncbi:hypothetical protein F53441_7990 [Fusarium austroafricanum]|uniref:Uncharacterized protein n=1 Tax=Fusarium austroafricanum TaxID=2364996 RepID=A0A8H4KC94_9HYPO|nr:hypothetical protein F53441_7990 [Fusarium austroafricanum]
METDDKIICANTKLPVEVILLIIEHLVTKNEPRPILPASDLTTKTLLALTTVSKAIYPVASRLLFQNCLYIDSCEKAQQFRYYLSQKSPVTGRSPCEAYGSARLFLSPFTSLGGYSSPGYAPVSPVMPSTPAHSLPHGDPEPDPLEPQHSEEAIPSPDYSPDSPVSPLSDLPTVKAVNEILITLAPILKSIVVDMPLRSLYPEDDHQRVRKILRHGFEALINIEELTSVRDELYLATVERLGDSWAREPEVWAQWPKLRRLALYNVMADNDLWEVMMSCEQLEVAVFTRPDYEYDHGWMLPNIKQQWCTAWNAVKNKRGMTSSNDEMPYQGPEITLAFCNWASSLVSFDELLPRWHALDPDNRICIMTVPTDGAQAGGDEQDTDDVIWDSQYWIKERALHGTLWENIKTENNFTTSRIERAIEG